MIGIGIGSSEFKRMGFTHFVNHHNGRTTCFVLSECEHCKAEIQAANSIGGAADDIPFYLSIGMKRYSELPPEGYYSENIEGEACYRCNA